MFPKGEYKDDIDALVQAILYLMDKPAKSPPKGRSVAFQRTAIGGDKQKEENA